MKLYCVRVAEVADGFNGKVDAALFQPIEGFTVLDLPTAVRLLLVDGGYNRARIYGNGMLELTGPDDNAEDAEQIRSTFHMAGEPASQTPAGETAGVIIDDDADLDAVRSAVEDHGTQLARIQGRINDFSGHVKAIMNLKEHVQQLQKDSQDALVCYTALEVRMSAAERAINMVCEGLVKAGIMKRVGRQHPADFYESLRQALQSVTAVHVRKKGRPAVVPGSDAAVALWKRVWEFRDGLNLESPDKLDVLSVADALAEWLDTLDAWIVELRDNGGDAETTDFVVQLTGDIRAAVHGLKVPMEAPMWQLLDRINATGQAEDYWQNRTLGDRIAHAIEYVEGCDLDDDDTVAEWIKSSPYGAEILAALERCGLTKRVKMYKLLRHLHGKSMGNNSLVYRLKGWARDGGPDEYRLDESVKVHLDNRQLPNHVRWDLTTALQRVSLDSSATLDEVIEELVS